MAISRKFYNVHGLHKVFTLNGNQSQYITDSLRQDIEEVVDGYITSETILFVTADSEDEGKQVTATGLGSFIIKEGDSFIWAKGAVKCVSGSGVRDIIQKSDGIYAVMSDGSEKLVSTGGGSAAAEGHIYDSAHDSLAEGVKADLGSINIASGSRSHAEGVVTRALGDYSHSEGGATHAAGVASHAEGSGCIGLGLGSHAEGIESHAEGYASHAEGYGTRAENAGAHTEGFACIGIGRYSHTEGSNNIANGSGAHAEGGSEGGAKTYIPNAYVSSIELKQISTTDNLDDYITYNMQATITYTCNNVRCFDKVQSIEKVTGVTNTWVITLLHELPASASDGISDAIISELRGNIAYNECSHAEGFITLADGFSSHAEGRVTQAKGDSSHAEGSACIGVGISTHAEGGATQAIGENSHAEGRETRAIGDNSHAEGYNVTALGDYSHAEGYGAHAQGLASHAEGDTTHAEGYASHTEGYSAHTEGYASHAEGISTYAQGNASHAEGYEARAVGDYSHASGGNTIAYENNMFVCGQYNDTSISGVLFAVGNGDSTTRSNGFYVTTDAQAYAGSWQTISDERLKDIKGEVSKERAYRLVTDCESIEYALKSNPDDNQVGLVAQQVKEVFPELVKEDSNGYLSIDYARTTAVLLRVVKDLNERLTTLERANAKYRSYGADIRYK